MRKLDIIKGKYAAISNGVYHDVNREGQYEEGQKCLSISVIASNVPNAATKDQEKDAAKLIEDAFNIYSESGLLPSELLKQNKELREAFKEMYEAGQRAINKTANPDFNAKAKDARRELREYYEDTILMSKALNSKP